MHAHPWCQRLLTPLPVDRVSGAVPADDPLWEDVETEMVKLGSLAHSQVDINAVAEQCMTLLESRTKDLRVVVQLLRCLQHPAKAAPFATAFMLLDDWVNAYWTTAWPQNGLQKTRLMTQVAKRFDSVLPRVAENASVAELGQLLTLAEQFARRWSAVAPDNTLFDDVTVSLRRAQSRRAEQVKANEPTPRAPARADVASSSSPSSSGQAARPSVDINHSDDRAWRQTQLKVAELLVEQQADTPVGYRLRRHAIWSGITTPPLAAKGNATQLAPMSADMADDYKAALGQADKALWARVEQSLVLAPYWFEGHMLSAQIAAQLGCKATASAIADELHAFLTRLPTLRELTFNDGTPFLTDACREWVDTGQANGASSSGQSDDLAGEAAKCRTEKGLNAALALLDKKMAKMKEPRGRFYAQLILADLLAEEGMKTLATQHYHALWQESQRLGLSQWEPGLVSRLERFATSWSK
ncbi:type VI secretion protein [Lonsdalea populi]|uniref:Type VI secretion system protein TssA n=1 Tax=Lonsdalea populi TaxID=1172565 RepID=A0A3N0UU38_9GAMM|nr:MULTISPECIES: type VI secretion system protein TssA [Lonsdalea]RAT16563.1 type VI secretion protein [Lonsdalea quercina]RAT27252.1 type VI secretion protein [Lonsdalea populi]RAT34363.1 type VI secretion protein [Lonsdalea populi]RAT49776.1 type VI secretion protein [Lonsdalea populi]RAT50796.1 type VI secretion protein [Lonsdalea populi]